MSKEKRIELLKIAQEALQQLNDDTEYETMFDETLNDIVDFLTDEGVET